MVTRKKMTNKKTAKKKVTPKKTTKKKLTLQKTSEKKSIPKENVTRNVVHEKYACEICKEQTAITSQKAKDLLGWEEEQLSTPYKKDYFIKDNNGVKIRCFNNIANRALVSSNVSKLKQEILRGRWHVNGEPIIIGRSGLILNGQHTLVALILAGQDWLSNKDNHPFWKTPPTIDKFINFGIDESDDVVNTMDTCKPRDLADVIYRSHYLKDITKADCDKISKMLSYAIKMLWNRTSVKDTSLGLTQTHSESIDFIDRHIKLIDCSKHIFEESGKESKLPDFIPPGYATALLYMMGSCTSSPEKYHEQLNEKCLDWKMYDKACDFFVMIAGDAKEIAPIRNVLSDMLLQNENISLSEKLALLIKAWNQYAATDKITETKIKLNYAIDEDGINRLAEQPRVGGIDSDYEHIPSPEEVTEAVTRIKSAKADKKLQSKPTKKTSKKTPNKKLSKINMGDTVLVDNGQDEPWKGKVVEALGLNAKVKIGQGQQGAGNIQAELIKHLTIC